MTVRGNVTWYDLCTNGGSCSGSCPGRCGCDDTLYHIAWPNIPAFPGIPNSACDYHCGTNPQLDCGASFWIYEKCRGYGIQVTVKDCCPCSEQQRCEQDPRCEEGIVTEPDYLRPLGDLTTAAFAALAGGLRLGRIPVEMDV